ncbi:MAG: hypothetical protein MZU97_04035 [Bacillus subtilis]|nr:hypothetical protein [Bacillus subtilis]
MNSTKLYINQALESLGFTDWTPIQSLVMPVLRESQKRRHPIRDRFWQNPQLSRPDV